MRTTDTLAGALVLALVAGGVYWARGRSAGPEGTALHPLSDRRSPSAGSDRWNPGPSGPGDTSPGAALPDVTLADATANLGEVRITLSVSPRPPIAFAKMRVRVRVESNGAPVELEAGRISFEMTMPMGDHRYTLVPRDDGWQEAEVVLPFCRSGNPRWHALVEGAVAGTSLTARFQLDLTKPSSSPLGGR